MFITAGIILAAISALFASAAQANAGSLTAPRGTCGAESNPDVAAFKQLRAMQCLTNYARQTAGLVPLMADARLALSAERKAGDILKCDTFSHYAWMKSPEHRANILYGQHRQLGLTLRIGTLEGFAGTHVWIQHFGDHCEPPT